MSTNTNYFNLSLDTASPSCSLLLGTNGFVSGVTNTLTINSADTDVAQMKIWGIVGTRSENLTPDGTQTVFQLSGTTYPETLTDVSVAGTSLTASDYSYDSTTGQITFVTAPAASTAVVVSWSETLTENTATWENYVSTKIITLPSTDGPKTVSAKVRDDVYNESTEATVTVTLDTTPPVVTLTAGPTPNKISKISGKNISQFTFQVSEDFTEYFVAVVPNETTVYSAASAIGVANGSVNMSGVGTFAAGTPIVCQLTGADLEAASPGDGTKTIKIFVKDINNIWSL